MIDLTGKVFGRLTVEARVSEPGVRIVWRCRCSCGNTHFVSGNVLSAGRSKSCGCLRVEHGRAHGARVNLKHGEGRNGHETQEYHAWSNMLSRCNNPKHSHYADYGGRGITVCERWKSYVNFLADMGRAPSDTSIDRVDNERGYEPTNCRWATKSEQNGNARNANKGAPVRTLEIVGRTRSLAQWLALAELPRRTFYGRVSAGETPQEIITKALDAAGAVDAELPVWPLPKKRPGRQAGAMSFNRQLVLCGKSRRLSEWLAICNLSRASFRKQAEEGMSPEDIILSALAPD